MPWQAVSKASVCAHSGAPQLSHFISWTKLLGIARTTALAVGAVGPRLQPSGACTNELLFFQKLTLMDSPGAWGLGAPGADSPGPPSTSTPLWPVRNTCINLGTTESRVPCTRFHLFGLLGLFFIGRIFSTRVAEYDHTCLLPVFFTCRFYVGARRAQIKSRVNFRSFRLTCLLLVTTSSLSCFPTNTCFINRRSQICRHGKLYVLLEF